MSNQFDEISRQIGERAGMAAQWMEGRRIETPADAAEAERLRADLAAMKGAAEDARDAERFPLIEAANAVQARYAPRLATLKRSDDLLRHALKAWKKQQRKSPK